MRDFNQMEFDQSVTCACFFERLTLSLPVTIFVDFYRLPLSSVGSLYCKQYGPKEQSDQGLQ